MNINFSIRAKVMVILKEQSYIDVWDGAREVSLISKENVKKAVDCPAGLQVEKLKAANIIAVKALIGRYVGDRGNGETEVIKVEPYYGLMNPEAEYLIIASDQIESINELIPQ